MYSSIHPPTHTPKFLAAFLYREKGIVTLRDVWDGVQLVLKMINF